MSKKVSVMLAALLSFAVVLGGCGTENLEVKVTPGNSPETSEKTPEDTAEQQEVVEEKVDVTQEIVTEQVVTTEETTVLTEEVTQEVVTEQTEKTETEAPVTEKVTEPPVVTETQAPQEQQTEVFYEQEVEPTYINGILVVNKTYPLPESYAPGELTSDTYSAFEKMAADAYAEGLKLWVQSGYRSYSFQKDLYNRYVASDGQAAADTYSARPGHSEHQSGLAFDLNTISDSFADTAEGQWVAENCHKYGFIVRYPKFKEHITGYKYEPWHLRYLGVETATAVYESGLCLEEYLGITSEYSY